MCAIDSHLPSNSRDKNIIIFIFCHTWHTENIARIYLQSELKKMSFVGRKEGRKDEVEVDVVVGYNLDDDFQTGGHSSQLR